ncbi:hypothetical protein P3L10_026019 [Capsicum annuum]
MNDPKVYNRWFMKLRLDRVLQDNDESGSLEEALASTPVKLEFENSRKNGQHHTEV